MENQNIRKLMSHYNALYKEMDDIYHSLARHYKLSDSAFWLLYLLREAEVSLTQSNMCEQLSMSKQTVNSALKILAEGGYVEMKPLAGNKKNKQILLTSAGESLAANTVDQVFLIEQDAFGRFSEQERTLFLQLNQKYVNGLQEEAKIILDQ